MRSERRRTHSLVQRAAATQKTIDRYRHRAFNWSAGATCIHLARTQLKAMGHAPPMVPRFTTPLGAAKALAETGHADLRALISAHVPAIGVSSLLIGDLVLLPGLEPFGQAIAVFAGAGAVLAWHGEDLSQLSNCVDWEADAIAAWRLG